MADDNRRLGVTYSNTKLGEVRDLIGVMDGAGKHMRHMHWEAGLISE